MSEKDFNPAYPPEENLGGQGHVLPPKVVSPEVQTNPLTPVPFDPIESVEPIIPRSLSESGAAGGDAHYSKDDAEEPTLSTEDRKVEEVKEEARSLAEDGKESVSHLSEAAQREVGDVMDDVKEQSTNLLNELGSDVRAQAATQQERIAENLRQISNEFRGMLDSSDASGTATSLVDQAARHSGNAADWLQSRDPDDLLEEVKGFARRRPGAFLGIALGAGLLAGRITRNAGSGPDSPKKETSPSARPSNLGEPRTPAPLPPTVNSTLGSGGAGGTSNNPGIFDNPTAELGSDQGYPRP